MIKAEIDRPKLERSLKRFAKEFGESNAQAVTRWAVSACRELAYETQAWGSKGTRKKQEGAIMAGAYGVLLVVDGLRSSGNGYRATNQGASYGVSAQNALIDAGSVNQWIEQNQSSKDGRTAMLPPTERKVCDAKTFKEAMKMRFKMAGMAKGGWIGAGMQIARAQKGPGRITIGKNFLAYAQKHAGKGKARKPFGGLRPTATIANMTAYSGKKNVLSQRGQKQALDWSLKKTVTWYRKSVNALDKKKAA